MEMRIFEESVTVRSADGQYLETFRRGERVKNIKRICHRVMFDPADPYRLALTYAMDWSNFEKNTTTVLSSAEAHSWPSQARQRGAGVQ